MTSCASPNPSAARPRTSPITLVGRRADARKRARQPAASPIVYVSGLPEALLAVGVLDHELSRFGRVVGVRPGWKKVEQEWRLVYAFVELASTVAAQNAVDAFLGGKCEHRASPPRRNALSGPTKQPNHPTARARRSSV